MDPPWQTPGHEADGGQASTRKGPPRRGVAERALQKKRLPLRTPFEPVHESGGVVGRVRVRPAPLSGVHVFRGAAALLAVSRLCEEIRRREVRGRSARAARGAVVEGREHRGRGQVVLRASRRELAFVVQGRPFVRGRSSSEVEHANHAPVRRPRIVRKGVRSGPALRPVHPVGVVGKGRGVVSEGEIALLHKLAGLGDPVRVRHVASVLLHGPARVPNDCGHAPQPLAHPPQLRAPGGALPLLPAKLPAPLVERAVQGRQVGVLTGRRWGRGRCVVLHGRRGREEENLSGATEAGGSGGTGGARARPSPGGSA